MEEWKSIPEYNGLYQVSNMGRVKSLARFVPHKRHGLFKVKERILKPGKDNGGYRKVILYNLEKRKKTHRISRLVAQAFLCYPIAKGLHVCHNDGDNQNDNLTNLRIDTERNNHRDKKRHGTQLFGESHGKTKFTDDQCLKMIQDPRPIKQIAQAYGASEAQVSLLKSGKARNYLRNNA